MQGGCWDLSEQEQRRGEAAGRGWGHHYINPPTPASLLLPPEPACSAVLLHVRPAWHVPGEGDGPPAAWIQQRNEVWSLPNASGMMSQHSLPQSWRISECWRLWSPARTPARGCQKWESSRSSSASPAGASRAAKRPGLILPWVDPHHGSWSGPCSLSAGNKGPFLVDEWAQCARPPARPRSPRPAAVGRQGLGSGVPRGHSAAGQLFRERAWPCQCSRSPLCQASQGRGLPWGRR